MPLNACSLSLIKVSFTSTKTYLIKCLIAAETVFVQLAFYLSNGVTDKLESSTILIYLIRLKVFINICGSNSRLRAFRVTQQK
jgi:hypothetical protein